MTENMRMCQQDDCILPATHVMNWGHETRYYCPIHAQWAIDLGDTLGYSVPRQTLRKLTPDEMLISQEEEEIDIITDMLVQFFDERTTIDGVTREHILHDTTNWVSNFTGGDDDIDHYYDLISKLFKLIRAREQVNG